METQENKLIELEELPDSIIRKGQLYLLNIYKDDGDKYGRTWWIQYVREYAPSEVLLYEAGENLLLAAKKLRAELEFFNYV